MIWDSEQGFVSVLTVFSPGMDASAAETDTPIKELDIHVAEVSSLENQNRYESDSCH